MYERLEYLEPLLRDKTEAWEEDNHGPMLRVCDLAEKAIEHLKTDSDPDKP